jgi:hypothetical protein
MPIEKILSLLIAERDRLDRAIEALKGDGRHRTGNETAKRVSTRSGRKPMTAAQKKAHSDRMRAFWASRRKSSAKS